MVQEPVFSVAVLSYTGFHSGARELKEEHSALLALLPIDRRPIK